MFFQFSSGDKGSFAAATFHVMRHKQVFKTVIVVIQVCKDPTTTALQVVGVAWVTSPERSQLEGEYKGEFVKERKSMWKGKDYL